MSKIKFKTRVTELIGCEYPILCGGMQWISRSEFVAQVCNAGGIGFITAETFDTAEELRQEIKKMHDLTDKPFGVNISMLPELGVSKRTLAFCDVVCEEAVPCVETSGRSPEPVLPRLKAAGIKVIHKVSSVKHAEKAQELGVDAVTLVGFGSGAHIGLDNIDLFVLIPLAVRRLKIPVIAGGGVGDGKGFLGALAMGAEGVLLGTRFLLTEECPIHLSIKEQTVQKTETETVLIMNTIRNPLRCARNRPAEDILALEEKGATLAEILEKVPRGKVKLSYSTGDQETPVPCGQVVGLIDEIKSVKSVVDDILSEAASLLDRLNRMAG